MGIRVLGPVAIDGAGQLSPRDRVVLGALVVDRDAVVGAERLADALWGDTPPASWRKVVQSSIVRLRRVLGANAIETMSTGYRLNLGIDDVDAWAFERLLDRASAFARYGEDDRAAFALDHALALWRGEPLADLEDWPPAAAEAVRLQELRRLGEERRAETLLARAEHERLIPIARSLLVDDRFRERRWELLALALYRAGRQAEALRVLADARRLLRDELGIEPRKELLELEQQILDQDRSIAAPVLSERAPSERCPYKGLESYDIDDVGWFFGREAIVEACSARVAGCGSLVIAGASGSGKSSVVRAGVIPRLRDDGCAVALMTPGPNPLMSLAAAIAATGPDAALVIDQAEELFSVCTDAAVRAEFCSAIAAHAERRPVVLVLRADHLGATTGHPELLHLVETSLQLLGPMNDEELRTAIERPARLSGCRLEPGLVDLLVRDVLDQPGALPLLSHALVETWARREANVLTVTGYREAGGVHGAVAKTAEQLYQALPASERPLVRAVLLRLVATDDTGDVVRHRLPMTALTDAPDQRVVVEALLAARLVTVGAEVLEISHEALARAWPRLQRWLEEDREGQRIRQHLSAAADGWEQRDRDPSELYRGARLRVALEWSQASSETLTRHERAFLDASNERERLEEADLRTRAEAHARANRRLWRSLGAVAVLLVLALVASAIATQQVSQASNERDRARRASREAATHNLVSQSLQLRGTNRDLAGIARCRRAPALTERRVAVRAPLDVHP